MIFIRIAPLLLTAIGAFFLGLRENAAVLLGLNLFTLFFLRGLRRKIFKNMLFLMIFVLPMAIARLLTARSGLKILLPGITVYSDALLQSANTLARILILAFVSNILVRKVLTNDRIKNTRFAEHPLMKVLFLSITLYQEMLADFVGYLRNLRKGDRKKRRGIVEFIDYLYDRQSHEEK